MVMLNAFGWIPLIRFRLLTQPPRGLWERLFHNRRDPGARHLFVMDVALNIKDEWYCFTHRLPPGSLLGSAANDSDRMHWTRIK